MAKKKESGTRKETKKKQTKRPVAKPARKPSAGSGASTRPQEPRAAQPKRSAGDRPAGPAPSLGRTGGPTPAGSVLLRPPRVDLPSPTPVRPRPAPVPEPGGQQVQPVTQADYPEFRRLLLAERERLLQELATMGERLQQVEEMGLVEAANEDDYGDVASEAFEREKGFALETSVQGMLRMVEEALRKLEAGTYGTCERCGGPIDAERLRALPFASLCIRCKAEEERESGSGNGWSG